MDCVVNLLLQYLCIRIVYSFIAGVSRLCLGIGYASLYSILNRWYPLSYIISSEYDVSLYMQRVLSKFLILFSVSLFLYVYVCLSVWLSVCLSDCVSVCLTVYMSDCLCLWLSVCLSLYSGKRILREVVHNDYHREGCFVAIHSCMAICS